MKFRNRYILLLCLLATLGACKKDNYDAPSSSLKGRIVYKGEAIGVENYQVPFQLYQYGFGKVGPIGSSFAQDGTYSALLFDGDYKLIVPNGQGPFLWKQLASGAPDSMAITMKGSQTLDLEVTPFYMIRSPQITGGSGKVAVTLKVDKIITDPAKAKNIEEVRLFINKTQFVSGGDNIASAGIDGAAIADPNNIALSVAVPSISPTQTYVFARVSIKIKDVEDRIFSPLVKVNF